MDPNVRNAKGVPSYSAKKARLSRKPNRTNLSTIVVGPDALELDDDAYMSLEFRTNNQGYGVVQAKRFGRNVAKNPKPVYEALLKYGYTGDKNVYNQFADVLNNLEEMKKNKPDQYANYVQSIDDLMATQHERSRDEREIERRVEMELAGESSGEDWHNITWNELLQIKAEGFKEAKLKKRMMTDWKLFNSIQKHGLVRPNVLTPGIVLQRPPSPREIASFNDLNSDY